MTAPRDELTRRLRDYYDATPAYHRRAVGSGAAPPDWDPNGRALAAHVRPGDRVLDLAGGAAGLRPRLPACRYTATDLSIEALRQGGSGVLADARRLPFADRTFDVVLCHHGLEHFAEPAAALGEAARVLAPGGRLVLCGPAFDSPRQPLPMVAHRSLPARAWLRLRLVARLVRNELRHAAGRYRYEPVVLEDVASFHGVGPPEGDYDAVHPTQLHETVFYLEALGLHPAGATLWRDHTPSGPGSLHRMLARLPVVRWMVRAFPLVAIRPGPAGRAEPAGEPMGPAGVEPRAGVGT